MSNGFIRLCSMVFCWATISACHALLSSHMTYKDDDDDDGPILWGYSGPLCHALSLLSFSWTSMRRWRATVAAYDSSDTW